MLFNMDEQAGGVSEIALVCKEKNDDQKSLSRSSDDFVVRARSILSNSGPAKV
jgi:hypothetical protein